MSSVSSRRWPKRAAICIDCRTTLGDSKDPHLANHEVVTLATSRGRGRLIDRVWGSVQIETQVGVLHQVSNMMVTLILVASTMLFTLHWWNGNGAVLSLLVGLVAHRVLERRTAKVIEYRSRSEPLPGARVPPRLAGGSAILGTVAPGPTAPSPLARIHAVAFSIDLQSPENPSARALVDAATIGFDIITAEGDVIRVPRGRIEIPSSRQRTSIDKRAVARYLAELDPQRRQSDEPDPFEHSAAAERVLRVGDHVALHNPIKRVGFDNRGNQGYRQAPRQVYEVMGTPCVELAE